MPVPYNESIDSLTYICLPERHLIISSELESNCSKAINQNTIDGLHSQFLDSQALFDETLTQSSRNFDHHQQYV